MREESSDGAPASRRSGSGSAPAGGLLVGDPEVAGGGRLVKRTLITLSHAIEQAACTSAADGPVVVMALFQRLPYFDRERAMYTELAARADVVVVGFVDDFRPSLPRRIHPVVLDVDEPLAQEWTVVVATPHMGAYLVAVDQETAVDGERTLESGRLFDGRWGLSAAGAHAELRRLTSELATRIPPGALGIIEEVVSTPAEARSRSATEDRVTASMQLLLAEAERTRRAAMTLRNRLELATLSGNRDLASQLHTPAYLERWTSSTKTMTAGPLPLALVLITIPRLNGISRYGVRAERETVRTVAAALTSQLRPVDRAVRLSEHEFLLVVPGVSEDSAAGLVRQVTADLDRLGDAFPFEPMTSVSAITVTRRRPLPIDVLRDTVDWAATEGVPIALLPA